MQFGLILNALLFFAAWMNLVRATGGPGNDCPCVSVSSTNIPYTKIKEYTIQKEHVCLFSVVVFWTVRGRIICADPNSKWAKHVIQKLKAKTRIQHFSQ
uniref:Chemokine interleukin-8-like domain-containing protein n=1 Tax=Poecilia formosa TaxID=48698 RepID=A0A096M514_POEFO